MGQAQSGEEAPPSHEEVAHELAEQFADKCFTSLEVYSLKDVFRRLADHQQNVRYLKEETIARYLEIPDVLGASPVLFHMVSTIGAFPFLQDAPAVLGLDQMVIVVTIMTERYRRVLVKGDLDRRKLLFRSLAVYDRKMAEMATEEEATAVKPSQPTSNVKVTAKPVASHVLGFAVDEPGEDEGDKAAGDEDEDDDLVLAALETLDLVNVFKHGNAPSNHGAMIPADNFRKLIMLLLLIAPLGPQEHLSGWSNRLVGDELASLRSTAESILASFLNVEKSPGIKFNRFNSVIPTCFPFMFFGFNALFEHFLFSKDLDLNKHKDGKPAAPPVSEEALQTLLPKGGKIMNVSILSQLSFFLPGPLLFRHLRLLYSGDEDGFSMGSFETKVFNWRAPTILLVRGTRLPNLPLGARETAFAATLPPRRFPHGSGDGKMSPGWATHVGSWSASEGSQSAEPDPDAENLTFGIFLPSPWRHTHRECFGDSDVALPVLFQLEPVHDVFHASRLNKDYASFQRPSAATATTQGGIAFGTAVPQRGALTASSSSLSSSPGGALLRRASSAASIVLSLGPVSLHVDASLEFGVFTHDYTARGGAYTTSAVRKFDFQERFAVEAVEVWGLGGELEAKGQADRWAWEAREAEARRRINLGTGDIEADRALLEMAGLVGANRSGGSMA